MRRRATVVLLLLALQAASGLHLQNGSKVTDVPTSPTTSTTDPITKPPTPTPTLTTLTPTPTPTTAPPTKPTTPPPTGPTTEPPPPTPAPVTDAPGPSPSPSNATPTPSTKTPPSGSTSTPTPSTKAPTRSPNASTSSGSGSGDSSIATKTPAPNKPDDSSNVITYAAIGAGVFVVAVGLVAFVLYRQKKAAELDEARTSMTPAEYYTDRRSQPYTGKSHQTSYRGSVDTRSSQKSTQRHSTIDVGNSNSRSTGPVVAGGEVNQLEGYDIRFDKSMSNFRVANEEVELFDVLARGGFGVIYHGRFAGEEVAVKKCLPEKVNNHEAMEAFMCEIKLMSKLDHPNIVRFVGVAWTTLLQLKMLTEFQRNGNVRNLLVEDKERRQIAWFGAGAVTKLRIASDVAEALVYLHTASPPIIHRDLKSSNVLLGDAWEAKLTDFGTSRELSDENTMTAEIGTLAWIAPEIMLGGHYTERADVYSFGVLLNELDLADLPYSNVTSDGFISHTRLGVMVAAGKIAPKFSSECPEPIAALGTECLRFEASSRPTAMQIAYRLRQMTKSTTRPL
ncbi:TKL protein kinase [Saprolegnia parasitica CBS 223.65]|uniref:TKL protein kinase n=1 Tax=Saprolegnia parasitica (strain CBS 223.65) TaxID=695850 RepID=A0A067D0B4_SAPPC|nr:TKL protein kinase [Saprolegnia parasitica CBS 223.65]KDO34965.1 TKL protein kinase [Saprolegnia parasitica CBS 223.65]|eukprot:XP_012194619.1 TKL protein kinase [Saprolegnia parasitica CBS 223.65]